LLLPPCLQLFCSAGCRVAFPADPGRRPRRGPEVRVVKFGIAAMGGGEGHVSLVRAVADGPDRRGGMGRPPARESAETRFGSGAARAEKPPAVKDGADSGTTASTNRSSKLVRPRTKVIPDTSRCG
jgi:hypothetical protein